MEVTLDYMEALVVIARVLLRGKQEGPRERKW